MGIDLALEARRLLQQGPCDRDSDAGRLSPKRDQEAAVDEPPRDEADARELRALGLDQVEPNGNWKAPNDNSVTLSVASPTWLEPGHVPAWKSESEHAAAAVELIVVSGGSEISASLSASPDDVENFAATARSGLLPACVPDRVTANEGSTLPRQPWKETKPRTTNYTYVAKT